MSDYGHPGERRAVYRYWAESIMAPSRSDEQILEYAENIIKIAKAHLARRDAEHEAERASFQAAVEKKHARSAFISYASLG